MKTKYIAHHHFKGDTLTPAEKVERRVVELIIHSKVPESKREDSLVFELKHSCGCVQIARILAQKRGLNIEIAEIASLLHDIYVSTSGTYTNHAKMGGPIAEKILKEIGGFSKKDIETIVDAVMHHSEKHIYSNNPYRELVKDVDVFDCSLYKGAEGDYRINKSQEMVEEIIKRIKKVRKELGMHTKDVWRA